MLLLTLRETYALNRLSSFKNLRRKGANLTTALGGQRSCYATAGPVLSIYCHALLLLAPCTVSFDHRPPSQNRLVRSPGLPTAVVAVADAGFSDLSYYSLIFVIFSSTRMRVRSNLHASALRQIATIHEQWEITLHKRQFTCLGPTAQYVLSSIVI